MTLRLVARNVHADYEVRRVACSGESAPAFAGLVNGNQVTRSGGQVYPLARLHPDLHVA